MEINRNSLLANLSASNIERLDYLMVGALYDVARSQIVRGVLMLPTDRHITDYVHGVGKEAVMVSLFYQDDGKLNVVPYDERLPEFEFIIGDKTNQDFFTSDESFAAQIKVGLFLEKILDE
jgi:hypothetical protein